MTLSPIMNFNWLIEKPNKKGGPHYLSKTANKRSEKKELPEKYKYTPIFSLILTSSIWKLWVY
jgi:hypothetical protein